MPSYEKIRPRRPKDRSTGRMESRSSRGHFDVSTGTVPVDQEKMRRGIDLAKNNVSLLKEVEKMFIPGKRYLRIYDKDGEQQTVINAYTKELFSDLLEALSRKERGAGINTRSNAALTSQEISTIWHKIERDCTSQPTRDVVSYLAGEYRVEIQENGGKTIQRIEFGEGGEPVSSKFEYVARDGKPFKGNITSAQRESIMGLQDGGEFFKHSRSGADGEPVTMMFEYVAAPKSGAIDVGTRKGHLIISMDNARLSKGNELDYLAPDSTEIRSLPRMDGASFCHCTIPSGINSLAGIHPEVEEVWYCLSGQCEIWRNGNGYKNAETVVSSGHHIEIPPKTRFQVRNQSGKPVYFLIVTVPPWPGDDAWEQVRPHWKQTGITPRPRG